jgi:hypothetical protein
MLFSFIIFNVFLSVVAGERAHFVPGLNISSSEMMSMGTLTGTNPSKQVLPLCKGSAYKRGKWIYNDNIKHKDFVCCGWDTMDHIKHPELCGSYSFQGSPIYTPSAYHYTLLGGHGCVRDVNDRFSVTEREKYIWEPDDCRLLPWNATQFCRLLGSRIISLVGDSTFDQFIGVIGSMIFAHGGDCARNLRFLHVNRLSHTQIVRYVQDLEAEIVFFGAAAHYHNVTEYLLMVNRTVESLISLSYRQPQTKYIVRGSHSGHVNCWNYTEPLQVPLGDMDGDRFEWNLHPVFDKEWERVANSYPGLFHFLDMTPLYLRPDAHAISQVKKADCLHFAVPGPMNLEANLLLTMLATGEI